MESIKQIVKDEHWDTISGLIWYSAGNFLFCSLIAGLFVSFKLYLIAAIIFVFLFIILELLYFSAWCYKRYIYSDSEELTIAFAIDCKQYKNDYLEIVKKISKLISDRNLSKIVKVKLLPSDIKFSTTGQAQNYAKRHGYRVLVWGIAVEGSDEAEFDVNISYLFTNLTEFTESELYKQINLVTSGRSWNIDKQRSLRGITLISSNLLEIVLFTAGICLITSQNIKYSEHGVRLLEQLYRDILNNSKSIDAVNRKQVDELLHDSYLFLSVYFWQIEHNLNKALEYTEKLIEKSPSDLLANLNLGLFYWLKGDFEESRRRIEKAWELKRGFEPTRISKAFLFFYDGKYDKALNWYKNIKDISSTNIIDVIVFLEAEYEQNKTKISLLFAAGWLNVKFVDDIRGKVQLSEYIEQCKDSSQKSLIEEAERLVS